MKRLFVTAVASLALLVVGHVSAQDQNKNNQNNQNQNKTGAQDQNKSGTQGQTGADRMLVGKVVRVDPDKGIIVIRTGEGTSAKEQQFKVGKTAKYYGEDRKEVQGGLTGFRTGSDIRYRTGTGDQSQEISELWMGRGTGTNNNENRKQSPESR